jgi:MtrB/PioB family decaheme-associated outer membrane protein
MTMKRIFISLAIAFSFFIAPQAFAEEQTLAGEVSLKGLLVNVRGNKAKFNEYRDLNDGLYGHVKLLYDTDAWWLKANANDIGYDTQKYQLDGGMWGAFKAKVFYRELPHNTTFGANSIYTGVGTNNLVLPSTVDPTNPATWPSSFDYSTERRQTGGSLSIDVLKPFFFNVSAMTEQRKGNKPAGVANNFDAVTVEIPQPIDYRTDTIKADLGYSKKPIFADLYFMYSDFDNKNAVLNFDNVGDLTNITRDTLTLPPDNKYYKVGFKGAVKLPLNSKFNINTGWSETTSKTSLLDTDLNFQMPLMLNKSVFNGKIDTQNLDLVVTTNPVDFLDGSIFYKYYNRDNKSDVITQDTGGSGVYMNRLFDYQKNQFGADLGFMLPLKFYLNTGYTHVVTNRPLDTLADTKDDIYSAELRWRGLDFMTVRTGYERLVRNSDFHTPTDRSADAPLNPNINADGAVNFDLADKTRDSIKLSVDLYPTDFLSVGVGYKHKENNYKQLQYGLKSDRQDEFYTNADVAVCKYVQLFGYFDYEQSRRSEDQLDTGLTPDAGAWNLKDKETYYDFGIGSNIFLIPKKLTLRLQYDYAKSNGNADFTLSDAALNGGVLAGIGANNNNVDIPNWDDYTKQTFMAKLIYDVTKRIAFSIGYAYEKFKYSDAQLDGYALVPTDGGAFLSGAFNGQSYNTNMYFATMTYKFW